MLQVSVEKDKWIGILFIFGFFLLNARAEPITVSNEPGADCGELGDCASSSLNCHEICGCDRLAAYHYNETTGECVLSFKHLMFAVVTKYEEYGGNLINEHGMAKSIRIEAEKIFQAILISVILVITCSVICVLSACFYCFRINYTDYRLKSDIKALAKKLKRNQTLKRPERKLPEKVAESCSIVCEDAGVFVV